MGEWPVWRAIHPWPDIPIGSWIVQLVEKFSTLWHVPIGMRLFYKHSLLGTLHIFHIYLGILNEANSRVSNKYDEKWFWDMWIKEIIICF